MLRNSTSHALPLTSRSLEKIKRSALREKPSNAVFGASVAFVLFFFYLCISNYSSPWQSPVQVQVDDPSSTARLAKVARSVRGSITIPDPTNSSQGLFVTFKCDSLFWLGRLRAILDTADYFADTRSEPLIKDERVQSAEVKARTLVLYVYASSDPEYEKNLLYFLREGILEHDGCEYVIAIQEGPGLQNLEPLPKLPPNARFVRHENKCFDLGTIGWMMDTKVVETNKYQYIIWLNSSVRGPFLPAYVKRRMHWTEALTDRLKGKVKMVGATISCGGVSDVPAVPHVQNYLVAVDQVGFKVLRQTGNVFKCWDSIQQTAIHSELGASAAIFMAGWSIDCLMLRYQGVNWRSKEALDCNAGLNPLQHRFNDGINVGPLESMFTKVRESMLGANWTHTREAIKYGEWSEHERGLSAADLRANGWFDDEQQKVLEEANRRSQDCFDFRFYIRASPDQLGYMWRDVNPSLAAWEHFLSKGILEGRPHRYTC